MHLIGVIENLSLIIPKIAMSALTHSMPCLYVLSSTCDANLACIRVESNLQATPGYKTIFTIDASHDLRNLLFPNLASYFRLLS